MNMYEPSHRGNEPIQTRLDNKQAQEEKYVADKSSPLLSITTKKRIT